MADRFMIRVAVFVILVNKSGEILLQRRAGTGYLDGYWDFPSGHVEPSEPLRDAAARELFEETGVIVAVEDLKLVHIDQYFVKTDYINFTFQTTKWQGEPRICEPDKHSEYAWFAPDMLPAQCVNNVRSVQRSGFGDDLTYSVTDRENYSQLMGESLPRFPS